MMNRRTFLCGIGLGTLATPLPAEAQRAGPVPRIGVLAASSPQSPAAAAFREGLRELGYVEGRSIVIEWRTAGAETEQFRKLAAELVRLNVAIIVALNSPAVEAAQNATRTVPIVMVMVPDPVDFGFVAGLARPGGNVTGLSMEGPTAGKRLELMREVVPGLSRVAILWDPADPAGQHRAGDVDAAKAVGVQVEHLDVRSLTDLHAAFATIGREKAGLVAVRGSGFFFTHRRQVAKLAIERRLPSMCATRGYVEAGCLMSYSADWIDLHKRSAGYVDKILRGARPADLPVERPTKFELVINLKTARALGLTIPPTLLLRADQVIE